MSTITKGAIKFLELFNSVSDIEREQIIGYIAPAIIKSAIVMGRVKLVKKAIKEIDITQ